MKRLLSLSIVLCLLPLAVSGCAAKSPPDVMGAYRFEDSRLLSIRRSAGATLRGRFFDSGKSRRLHPDGKGRWLAGPGFSGKSPVEVTVRFQMDGQGRATGLTWQAPDGDPVTAKRVNREEWLSFDSGGTNLAGRLTLPQGPGPHPAIVLVHGSGSDAATDYYYNADFFAAHGIATLTYDKRGTGRSEGEYTFDFQQLAEDAAAAVAHLLTRADVDRDRVGLAGYSQGGWVAPLAASLSKDIGYVIVSCGLIGSPAEEARVETRNTLRQRGVDEASLDRLDELTTAAVRVVAEDFKQGWDEFERLKKKYKRAPWAKQLEGTVVGKFVAYPRWLVKAFGPRNAPRDLPWYYDSPAVLERLEIPMVWMVAEEDASAPPELTVPALRRLQETGKPYELIAFPGADHTMLLFHEESGERVYTGYAPGYFEAEVRAARRFSGLE